MMVGMDRRKFIAGMAGASLGARAWAKHHGREKRDEHRLLFVGTQTKPGTSKGIYTYKWNEHTGELSHQQLAAAIEMPTFLALAPDGKHLYAANEADDFQGKKS